MSKEDVEFVSYLAVVVTAGTFLLGALWGHLQTVNKPVPSEKDVEVEQLEDLWRKS